MIFERGKTPKESLGIGLKAKLKKQIEDMGGLVLTNEDLYESMAPHPGILGKRAIRGGSKRIYQANVVIIFEDDDTFMITKNRFGQESKGDIMKDLPKIVKDWKKSWKNMNDSTFQWVNFDPKIMKKISEAGMISVTKITEQMGISMKDMNANITSNLKDFT